MPNIIKNKWVVKLKKLYYIISGLNTIHQQKFVHCDFHHGNILFKQSILSISDLGLCKPVEYFQTFSKKNDIYGVLPFIAPEILRGKPYTSASDIYSFAMIMWEFISGIPPFNDRKHDLQLGLNICRGERPEIMENTPQCYIDLMEKCWDEDPLKRPNALEICNIIKNWYDIIGNIHKNFDDIDNDIMIEFWKAEERKIDISTKFKRNDVGSHPQAYHTSRLLGFTKELNEILDKEDIKSCVLLFETQSIGNYFKVLKSKIILNVQMFILYLIFNRSFKDYRKRC